jgi:hypothetical protein
MEMVSGVAKPSNPVFDPLRIFALVTASPKSGVARQL